MTSLSKQTKGEFKESTARNQPSGRKTVREGEEEHDGPGGQMAAGDAISRGIEAMAATCGNAVLNMPVLETHSRCPCAGQAR